MIYGDTSALVPVFSREAKSEPTGRPGTAVLSTKQCDGDVAEKQPGRGRQLPLSMGPVQTLDTPPIVTVMLSRSTKPVPWSVPSSKTSARPVSVPANMSNSDALRRALAAPRVRMAGDPYESSSHLVGSPGEGEWVAAAQPKNRVNFVPLAPVTWTFHRGAPAPQCPPLSKRCSQDSPVSAVAGIVSPLNPVTTAMPAATVPVVVIF